MSISPETHLTVSPTTKQTKLNPGESYTGELNIFNPSPTESLHYKVTARPYSVIGTDNVADLSTVSEYTKVTDWLTVDYPEGVLEPNSLITVHYTISVPQDAISGGQYCALSVQGLPNIPTDADGNQATIGNVIEISSLIYSQIGDPVYDGKILANKIPQFSFTNSITTTASVQNTGGVHQTMHVATTAYSALTGKQILLNPEFHAEDLTTEEIAEKGTDYYSEVILPDTTRYSLHQTPNFPLAGVFNVTQEIAFNGTTDTFTQTVIICPLWLIGVFCAILFLIVFAIIRAIKKHRQSTHSLAPHKSETPKSKKSRSDAEKDTIHP